MFHYKEIVEKILRFYKYHAEAAVSVLFFGGSSKLRTHKVEFFLKIEPFPYSQTLIVRCTDSPPKGECKIEDSDFVLMIQRGNPDAFDPLFEKYKQEAVRTAYLITGRKSICEDIAQEAFIQCYKHIGELKNPNGFRAWFFRILTRTAWKYGRSASREIPTEDITEKAEESSVDLADEQYLVSEENRLLYSEIDRLEQKQKTVIVLYYFNGLSTKEIAKVSGCLEGTVKSRLFSARKKLKSEMESFYSSGKERGINAYKTV